MTVDLLQQLGERVRERRTQHGWTQREICTRAGLSPRFLIQLEGGSGNVSLRRLADLAQAMECSLVDLLGGLGPVADTTDRVAARIREMPPREQRAALAALGVRSPRKIALVGLRGAGKSTVGRAVADHLGSRFIALDALVQERAGMSLGEIFEFHGGSRYRELCGEVLHTLIGQGSPMVLEVGGSLVLDTATYQTLRDSFHVYWLRASAEAHLQRVRDQGDLRPMAGRQNALAELRAILARRGPLYALAHAALDTEELGIQGTVTHIVDAAGAPAGAS